jgi:hypothetical protein
MATGVFAASPIVISCIPATGDTNTVIANAIDTNLDRPAMIIDPTQRPRPLL